MFYYEVYDYKLKTNKYYGSIAYVPLDLTLRANRIWREEGAEVKFIKNRNNPEDYPVDLKQFMWI